MMNRTRKFRAVTRSRNGWEKGNGTFEGEVTLTDRGRFVSLGPFGCSRDYVVMTDQDAVVCLLGEHACELVAFEYVDVPVRVIFTYDEAINLWTCEVDGAVNADVARHAFAAVVITCHMLEERLLSATLVGNGRETHIITPAV